MSSPHRSRIAAALMALALITAACSSSAGAGNDSGGAATETTAAAETVSGDLSSSQLDAFRQALLNGNGSESMTGCLFEKVQEAVDAGDLTPGQVVDWTEGRGFDGPVQDYISQVDVVMECSAAG